MTGKAGSRLLGPMDYPGGPFQPPAAVPPPGQDARQDLNIPSLLLLITAAVSLLMTLGSMVVDAAFRDAEQSAELMRTLKQAGAPQELMRLTESLVSGPLSLFFNFMAVGLLAAIAFGAWQMRQLKLYPAAIAACAIGLLPCGTGCCCVLTFVPAAWALIVLLRPEVRAQFS